MKARWNGAAKAPRPTLAILGALCGLAMLASSAEAAQPSGRVLFAQHCEQCHQAAGAQDFGNIGPSLVGVRTRYTDSKQVTAIVWDETRRNPQTVMPPFGRNLILTGEEIAAIVGYLYTQGPLMADERGDH